MYDAIILYWKSSADSFLQAAVRTHELSATSDCAGQISSSPKNFCQVESPVIVWKDALNVSPKTQHNPTFFYENYHGYLLCWFNKSTLVVGYTTNVETFAFTVSFFSSCLQETWLTWEIQILESSIRVCIYTQANMPTVHKNSRIDLSGILSLVCLNKDTGLKSSDIYTAIKDSQLLISVNYVTLWFSLAHQSVRSWTLNHFNWLYWSTTFESNPKLSVWNES